MKSTPDQQGVNYFSGVGHGRPRDFFQEETWVGSQVLNPFFCAVSVYTCR